MNNKFDKFETSFINNSLVQTPKPPNKQNKLIFKEGQAAKSFRLLFSNNHFLQKSYKNSLHYSTQNDNFSNKLTTISTCQKSDENKPLSLSFLKKLQISTSKLEAFSSHYQKLLSAKICDEKFDVLISEISTKFSHYPLPT